MTAVGQVVILNGVPRSGKSTVARAVIDTAPGIWVNLGVDAGMAALPERLRPGLGLRPGGEHPELEDLVVALYSALYASVAAYAHLGINVVVDVAHHESYSRPLHVLRDSARRLEELPVLWVGVRCPLDVVWRRREETWGQERATADEELRTAVDRWQVAVHAHGPYDLEVDTSLLDPDQCAHSILSALDTGPAGRAFTRFATS